MTRAAAGASPRPQAFPVRLAITMGDPGGIGPEVVLKAIARPEVRRAIAPILVGDAGVWQETGQRLGAPIRVAAQARPGHVQLAVTSELPAAQRVPGAAPGTRQAAARGEAAYRAILEGVRLVRTGAADALVTAPICKAHLAAAGHDYPGHTELLAHLCGGVPVRMMMVGGQLRVVLVTIHMALAKVPRCLHRDRIVETIRLTAGSLRRQFGIQAPRIAVAGLNPHAGEDGLFGKEERRIILPAVRAARGRDLQVLGPLAADGIFGHAANGRPYDAIVCMYHDQGLAPFKFAHFADGVNFTLGLPLIRTSPDHGTAFDIAGRGEADARSMAAALQLAASLAQRGAGTRPRRGAFRG